MSHFPFSRVALIVCAYVLGAADAASQSTTRVSVLTGGGQADGSSGASAASADGRYVAFLSDADNLGAVFGYFDVMLRDRVGDTTINVSAGTFSGDVINFALSSDGRFLAFDRLDCSFMGCIGDVYLYEAQGGSVTHISVSPSSGQILTISGGAALADDGSVVAFHSQAADIVAGDTNGVQDVFVRDVAGASSTRVSVSSSGVEANGSSGGPSMSADGRYVLFTSGATNLVVSDTNGVQDVFLHDRQLATTTRVSVSSSGSEGLVPSNPGFPPASDQARISADGLFAVFRSNAADLVATDTNGWHDVLIRDLAAGTTALVSLSATGLQSTAPSGFPSISSDGRFVSFQSQGQLAGADLNPAADVFLRDRKLATTVAASFADDGSAANNAALLSAVSPDGRTVYFNSHATNLVGGDTNAKSDVFARDRGPSTIYCTAKINSQGCSARIVTAGTPSASASAVFDIGAQGVINNKSGLLFYGFDSQSVPFQGGYLCVKSPTTRTLPQSSGGNPPPTDCSGAFSYDFNARIQSAVDLQLVAGAEVACQYWYRDPASASTTGLTNALWFVIEP